MKKNFSVVAGRVSTEDSDRVLQLLASLRQQTGGHGCEVVLADRRNDAVTQRIRAEFPEVALFVCPSGTSLPELRTLAFERSSGEYVVVTEDHCVPPPDWLESISNAFDAAPPGTPAVGGCVENGVTDSALDWATFICEYAAFVGPLPEGATSSLPGMNVAYRREALLACERQRLTEGFWETTVHPAFVASGRPLYLSNAIRIHHCKKFSLGLFADQRFIYSRYYAGLRFARAERAKRFAACVASLALPPLLFLRMVASARRKPRLQQELLRASPYLLLFIVIWAVGEMVGYAAGAGRALQQIE